ncbi:MAG: peptidase S15, partial [Opitutales bacterium]
RFAQGHQIRLAVSTTLWPLAWPPPCPAALTIHGQASHLELPTRPTTGENAEVAFDEPVAARGLPMQTLRPPDAKWQVFRDLGSEASALEVLKDHGETLREDIDLAFSNRVKESYRFQGDDFLSARGETEIHREWSREGWHCEIKGRTRMTCDEAKFYIYAELDAFLNRERMFSKTWKESIPRNFQ